MILKLDIIFDFDQNSPKLDKNHERICSYDVQMTVLISETSPLT